MICGTYQGLILFTAKRYWKDQDQQQQQRIYSRRADAFKATALARIEAELPPRRCFIPVPMQLAMMAPRTSEFITDLVRDVEF